MKNRFEDKMRAWLIFLFFGLSFSASALADQSYGKRLVEHLQRFQQYPASAKARRAQGEALVAFTVDRDGKIVSSNIARSSGDIDLDQAALEMLIRAQPLPPLPPEMANSQEKFTLPVVFRRKGAGESSDPDVDLSAFMAGRCSKLRIAGSDFNCKSVSYFHTRQGRANFTIVLDDPADDGRVVSFSGENGRKVSDDVYELPIDRMLLNSKDRPKVNGLPVPFVEPSAGICKQVGNFSARQVSSVICTAMDRNGKQYELAFESDGSPMVVKNQNDERVNQSSPAITQTSAARQDSVALAKSEPFNPAALDQKVGELSRGSYVGKWYVDDPAACAGDLPEGGLLVYSTREFRGYESSCQITKSVLRGTKTDLTMRCSVEGMTSAELDHETLEVVGGKLKRTVREGRKQRTMTFNRCPSETVRAGEKLSYGSRTGMTVTVASVSGINTHHAVIRTKHTRQDATIFCRDYLGNVTDKCVQDTMTTPIAEEVTGNCVTGQFKNFYGEGHQYLGEMKSTSDDVLAKYMIKNLATGQIANGSNGSGYPTNMAIFRALCPLKAPADD